METFNYLIFFFDLFLTTNQIIRPITIITNNPPKLPIITAFLLTGGGGGGGGGKFHLQQLSGESNDCPNSAFSQSFWLKPDSAHTEVKLALLNGGIVLANKLQKKQFGRLLKS